MPKIRPLQKIFCHECNTFLADVVGVHVDADNIRTVEFSLQTNCPNQRCPSRHGDEKKQIVFTIFSDLSTDQAIPAASQNELDAIAITLTRKEWRALTETAKADKNLARLPRLAVMAIERLI